MFVPFIPGGTAVSESDIIKGSAVCGQKDFDGCDWQREVEERGKREGSEGEEVRETG